MTEQTLAIGVDDDLVPAAAAPGLDAVPVEPAMAAEPGSPLRSLLPLAVLVSCGLHAAAAAAMLLATAGLPEYGVLQEESEALSLEMTQTIVLESTSSEPVEMAAAAAAMPQGSVAAIDAEPQPVKEVEAAEIDPAAEASDEPLEVLRGAGEPAETAPLKAAEPEQEVERPTKPREEAQRRQRTTSEAAGGPTSRSSAARTAASGRASASRGSVLSYAARVRAKVASNKPSGRGHRGTARVSFGVSSSGGLAYATLSRSSGNAALDQAALAAVRRAAPFGAPPSGTSSAQLRFSIPFYFR
jgi:protein TonB